MAYTLVVKEYQDYVIPYITIKKEKCYISEARVFHEEEASKLKPRTLLDYVKLFEDDELVLAIHNMVH